ncbi:MAG: transporter, family, oxalate/formate antiporter [Gammaproteobacteria bacterium]|nr:transporter, family, oxalate/formate antiporter [Gammaproteobacteria bacterium]
MTEAQTSKSPFATPWIQLTIGVICMAAVANLQYGWTLFVNPIDAKYHAVWGLGKETIKAIQWAFTLFVAIETFLVPVEGYLVDKYGPRVVVLAGSVLVGIAWVMNSYASTLTMFYVAAAVGGVGVGAVYGTCVGNALKWFPGRRGLAAGITAMGFGAGAALTTLPVENMIKTSGYEQAFFTFGIAQAIVVFVAAWGLLVAPPSTIKAVVRANQSARSFAPREVLTQPIFWVMYLMFLLVASGLLVLVANLKPIGVSLHMDKLPVFGMTATAMVFALTLNRVFDGIGRPTFGWISDKIGREYTMAIAFTLGAITLYALGQFGSDPAAFVVAIVLYFGVSGEIYSLFPATQGDTFGAKFAAANAGMLYTAKGVASFVVPYASGIAATKGWPAVFAIAIGFNLAAAALALFVLRPMRLRHFTKVRAELASTSGLANAAA